jgi:hypothetical protein
MVQPWPETTRYVTGETGETGKTGETVPQGAAATVPPAR